MVSAGELAWLSQWNEAGPEGEGDRGRQCEPAGFDSRNDGDPGIAVGLGQGLDQLGEGPVVGQDRGYVFEDHPGLGKVGDVPDQAGEVHLEILPTMVQPTPTSVSGGPWGAAPAAAGAR